MTDAAFAPDASAEAPAAAKPARNPVVWTEIPVTDLAAGKKFYETLTGRTLVLDETGPNAMAMFPYVEGATDTAGHLYVGKPAPAGTGPTIHVCVPDTVEAAAARCNAAGGQAGGPIITIPPGRFQYATDPDGNSIGLFQPA